ncbi:hypothetical protein MBLNU230_g2398t1 [Neophaeotheca triangularis]
MGGSASKTARSAGAAARQYPKRTPAPTSGSANTTTTNTPQTTTNSPPQPPPAPTSSAGPTVRPQPRATGSRSEAINLDASDPDFARSLRSLGPVQPNPTMSPTSAFQHPGNTNRNATQSQRSSIFPDPRQNPAVAVLESRAQLQAQADEEGERYGKSGFEGREFLDVFTIRQIMVLRDGKGESGEQIERRLGLKRGTVERLGPRGVVAVADEAGRAEKEISMV